MILAPNNIGHSRGQGSPLAGVAIILAVSAMIMGRQVFSPYYYSCFISDTWQYSSWAWQFNEILAEGVLYPAWTPFNFWGFGSPTFILYPPLAFYLTAFFEHFSGSLIFGMNMTKFLSLFAGAVGAYFFARDIYGERVGRMTGTLYAVFPFHVMGLYIGGGFPSTISFMWFPLILLFAQRFVRGGRLPNLLYAGGAYGGLILTHLINAYMFTFVVVGYFGYMAAARRRVAVLAGIPAVILTGAATSAAYLLPFLEGKEHINYRSIAENFPYSDYFLFPKHEGTVVAEKFWQNYYGEFVTYALVFLALTMVLLVNLGGPRSKRAGKDRVQVNRFLTLVSIGSIFLLCEPSAFLWKTVPFLKYVNIAVRWLNITSFAVVLLFAGEFYVIDSGSMPRMKKFILYLLFFGCCLLADSVYLSSSCIFERGELLPARDINWLPEHLPAGVDANMGAKEENEELLLVEGEGTAKIIAWKSEHRSFMIRADEPLRIEVRTFYFPGWKAYINGVEVHIGVKRGTGSMILEVPSGSYKADLVFEDSLARKAGKALTMSSVLLVGGTALIGILTRKRREANWSSAL